MFSKIFSFRASLVVKIPTGHGSQRKINPLWPAQIHQRHTLRSLKFPLFCMLSYESFRGRLTLPDVHFGLFTFYRNSTFESKLEIFDTKYSWVNSKLKFWKFQPDYQQIKTSLFPRVVCPTFLTYLFHQVPHIIWVICQFISALSGNFVSNSTLAIQ